jgi:hypothetical protein
MAASAKKMTMKKKKRLSKTVITVLKVLLNNLTQILIALLS